MGPTPIDLSDRIADEARREEEEERIMKRFEKLGTQIMHRSGGSMLNDDGVSGVLADGGKRTPGRGADRAVVRDRLQHDPPQPRGHRLRRGRLVSAGELYGDDVVQVLEDARLERPEIDLLDEDSWPVI